MDEKTIVANAGEQSELISVIIPTYNRVGLLERSVKSVLSQTYTNLELLIIDDCSNDATGEFVKGLSDKRIRYYRNEQNIGPAASKNKGAALAGGELLAFQDDDDEWLPNKLMRLMEVWKKEGSADVGMIYHEMQEQGTSQFIPSRDIPTEWKSQEIFRYMLLYPLIGGAASLIRKSCLDELGGFNEKLESIEDYEFYLRMAKKYRILFVGEPLMIIYDTPGSVNKRFKSKINTELYVLDTMYDSLCRYDILQKKVNLIRQQAENYDCEDYFYEQALQLCERLIEEAYRNGAEEDAGSNDRRADAAYYLDKGRRIRECIGNAAREIGGTKGGDRAEYYQNAAGQIQRVVEGLTRLRENLKKNPVVLSKNKTDVVAALSDIIKSLGDYTDLALHPVPQKQRMDELLEKLTEGRNSGGVIEAVLDDTLKEAKKLFSQIGKAKCLCSVCGKEVRFLPPSPYKRVMREHYGYKGENVEFLFEGEEDRCPVCGAPENIRFLLGFLEDVQPEGGEKLKMCCIEASDVKDTRMQEWIRKYASIKEYMEYIPPKDIEAAEGKIDVIVCMDVLERAADDSEIPEKIGGLLGEGGVCIVMTPALLKEASADLAEENSVDSAKSVSSGSAKGTLGKESGENEDEAHGAAGLKLFGLEGVKRIYRESELAAKLEEAGFSVETVDENWFGRDYYEQYGFGEKAKMFMLTKKMQRDI